MIKKAILLILTFIIKLRFPKHESVQRIIEKRYGRSAIKIFRGLQNSTFKATKCSLDLNFLTLCKAYNTVPKFMKFKLYKKSLQERKFYNNWLQKLLIEEINFTKSRHKTLKDNVKKWEDTFDKTFISMTDNMYLKNFISRINHNTAEDVENKHRMKLAELGISNKLIPIEDTIFNYSSISLSKREKFLLSLGLDFKLPNYNLDFINYFASFEKLANILKFHDYLTKRDFNDIINNLKFTAHKYFYAFKPKKIFNPLINQADLKILKNLSKNPSIIVSRPDKGRGTVIIDKSDYVNKMNDILSDTTKFVKINSDLIKLNIKLEDTVNNLVNNFRKKNINIPSSCAASGTSLGKLYGLPKVHKTGLPLRPVMSACSTANFNLAKYIVKLLDPTLFNEFSTKNSFEFIQELSSFPFNNNQILASFDVKSLFTSIPVRETIDIILNMLFVDDNILIEGMNKGDFKKLLTVATDNTYFLFNGNIYKQCDGMAMGSPLGPVFANIFMHHLEKIYLDQCPSEFKPKFYKRYVDDTYTIFDNKEQAMQFLNYINSVHPNIEFTIEFEINSKISFLDILIHKNNKFEFSVFRKKMFTGLSINFFSYCPLLYKINSLKTLLNRSFRICSNYEFIHFEFKYLQEMFVNNCFPLNLANSITKKFLNRMFSKPNTIFSVPKKLLYVSLPYFGPKSELLKVELFKYLSEVYPSINFKFALYNNFSIGSFFNFKDRTIPALCSGVIYDFKCPHCNIGYYVGSTTRSLHIRTHEHMGISYRTKRPLAKPSFSAIRKHCEETHGHMPSLNDFNILKKSINNSLELHIIESLFIKKKHPDLNTMLSSFPLYIA